MKQNLKRPKLVHGVMLLLMLLFSGFTTFNLQAQSQIKGTVLDAGGNPIPGVSVLQKGTSNGVVTDFDGIYSLKIKSGQQILIFSYLGFETQEVNVAGKTKLNVEMKESAETLEEIVIIGYQAVKKENVLGAVSGVKAAAIEEATPVQPLDGVQGKLSGVQIISNNGPGQGFEVRVRGVSTFSGAGAGTLYVVDGQQLTDIDNLDPNDIESLEVVKDAATAAVYGSRAANGVVVITTKKGKAGKLDFTVNSTTGVNVLVGDLQVANSAQRFLFEAKQRNDLNSISALQRDSLSVLRRNDNDLQDILTAPAIRTNTTLGIRGGSDKATFSWTTGFLNEDGVIRNSGYKRINTRLRIDATPFEKFRFGTNVNLSFEERTGVSGGGAFIHIVERLPYLPLFDQDGSLVPTIGGRKNPLAFTDVNFSDDRNFRGQVNNYAELDLFPGFKVRSTLGINWRLRRRNDFESLLTHNRFDRGAPRARFRDNLSHVIQQENYVNYNKTFKKHSFSGFAGTTLIKRSAESEDFRTLFLSNELITRVGNADPGSITANSGVTKSALFSLFGGFDYDYKGKYLVGATIRRDASSRFGSENQSGFFPAVKLGWKVSKENFLENNKVISNLLLRATWGIVGNEAIGDFEDEGLFGTDAPFNGLVGFSQNTPGNSSLKWEETTSYNFGLTLGLFKNRFGLDVDFWQKDTNDLLANVSIPEETGFATVRSNVGSVQNRGIDFSLSAEILKKKGFSWNSSFNISYFENEITSLGGPEFTSGPDNSHIIREGESIGTFHGYKNLGVFQYTESNAFTPEGVQLTPVFDEQSGDFVNYTLNGQEYTGTVEQLTFRGNPLQGGDIIWQDTDGDFDITPEDRTAIGNALANVYGGFNNRLKYKNFTLDTQFDYTLGQDIYNRWDETRNTVTVGRRTPGPDRILNAWTAEGDVTVYPRLTDARAGNGRAPQNALRVNSFFVTDASFIKWRYARLGYKIPKDVIDKLEFIKSIDLNFSVNNVLTWTNYNGYNPELGSRGGNPLTPGIDGLRFPNDREFILGLRVRF